MMKYLWLSLVLGAFIISGCQPSEPFYKSKEITHVYMTVYNYDRYRDKKKNVDKYGNTCERVAVKDILSYIIKIEKFIKEENDILINSHLDSSKFYFSNLIQYANEPIYHLDLNSFFLETWGLYKNQKECKDHVKEIYNINLSAREAIYDKYRE